jgi:CRISPR-associated protein Cmr5
MTIHIRSQRFARAAFEHVVNRQGLGAKKSDYLSFTRSFPSLIHTSGLAQAVAFALAKGTKQIEKRLVIEDLCSILHETGTVRLPAGVVADGAALAEVSRTERDCSEYMRMTKQSLQAASWLKRYAEALLVDQTSDRATGQQFVGREEGSAND